MKKISKMLALGMAAALVFGMTVSAAGSPTTEDPVANETNKVIEDAGVQDAEGNVVSGLKVEATAIPETVYSEAFGTDYEEAVAKAEANDTVKAAIDKAFTALGNGTVKDVVSNIIDVSVVEGTIPESGLYVPVTASVNGKGYVVAHWNGAAWEVLTTKIENGAVYALFTRGFSPVCISVLTLTGEEAPTPSPTPGQPSDSNNNNNNSSNDSAAPASPKTGETLPVAGILAVICLAAAAVCAKKVRYNR